MSANLTPLDQAESRRRELLRAARYEAFVQRTIEINRKLQAEQDRILSERRLRARNSQLELEYVI